MRQPTAQKAAADLQDQGAVACMIQSSGPSADQSLGRSSHGVLIADMAAGSVVAVSRRIANDMAAAGSGNPPPGAPLDRWFEAGSVAIIRERASRTDARYSLDPVLLRLATGGCVTANISAAGTLALIELWPETAPDSGSLQNIISALSLANRLSDLDALADHATRTIAALTGYDQVLFLRFNDHWDADVLAESRRPSSSLPPFRSERIQASNVLFRDRACFEHMPLVAVPDTGAAEEAVCGPWPDGAPILPPTLFERPPRPLLALLDAIGVRAHLALALTVRGGLWGLIVCHHETPRPLTPAVMAAAQVFVETLSGRLDHLISASAAESRARLFSIFEDLDLLIMAGTPLTEAIRAVLDDIMTLFSTPSAILSLHGQVWTEGGVPGDVSVDISSDEPLIVAERFDGVIGLPPVLREKFAGGILIPLSERSAEDFLLLGRPAVHHNIRWAGTAPAATGESRTATTTGALSLTRWNEERRGCALPFTAQDRKSAHSLHLFLSRRVHDASAMAVAPPGEETDGSGLPHWHDASMDWFWETDAEGRLTTATRFFEDVDGNSSESVIGRHLTDFLVVDPRVGETSDLEELQTAFNRGCAFHGLTGLMQLPGFDQCWARLSGFPIRDASGTLIGFRGAATNVTRLRALQEEKIRTQRLEALGRMASGIAHEINNVLQPMLTMSYYATKRIDDREFVRSALADIEESGLRAREIVKAILAFGRQAPSDRYPIRIAAELEKAIAFACKGLPHLSVDLDIEPTGLEILGNTTELSQIVLNLLTNAADAMGGPGRVTVTLRAHGDTNRIHVTVRDEGPGMDLSTRNRIFDPFFTTKAEGKGTGMGLAVVHGLVEAWGGTVGVESMPGLGTTFWISLPAIVSP